METQERLVLPDRDSGRVPRDVVLIVLLGALLIFPSFFTRNLWNPDEPRYMELTREMVVLHDYVVPHLNGQWHPDKPPLFMWSGVGFYKLGFGLLSCRMASGLATLGTLLLVYFFGRRLYGAKAGRLAALATATTFLFTEISKDGVADTLITFLETGAILAAYLAMNGKTERARLWWLAFYAGCGLAVLCKGPVGMFTPGVFVLVYALFNRKAIRRGGWMHAAGAALMLIIIFAWLVPAMIRGGAAYSRDILFHQQAVYTIQPVSHVHGPHYYLMQLPLYLFPWVFFFGLALADALIAWRRRLDRDAAFLALWFVCILAFFSIIPAKRERYLLPMIPAVGLLCARYWTLTAASAVRWPKLQRWFGMVTFCLIALMGVGVLLFPWVAPHVFAGSFRGEPDLRATVLEIVRSNSMKAMIPFGALCLVLSAIGINRGVLKNRQAWLIGALVAAVACLSLLGDFVLYPAFDPMKSGKAFCAQILPYLNKSDRKYMYGNDYAGLINLHTGITSIPLIEAPGKPDAAALLEVFQLPARIAVISDQARILPLLKQLPKGVRIAVSERIGHRGMVLLCNWEDPAGQAPREVAPPGG